MACVPGMVRIPPHIAPHFDPASRVADIIPDWVAERLEGGWKRAGRVTSQHISLINDRYNASTYYRFEWAGLCDDCELQKQCTRRKDGRRHISVGRHHDLLQQRRRDMKTDEFKLKMHRRNAIEGTISEFTRGGGRRTRYRGLAKTTLSNYFQGAAVNINRWLRLSRWEVEKQLKAA
ncbi:MAG: transposase [Lentisphaerae bacterium]|nr:transposase [Lentisphaerota bacterium]